MNLITIAGPVFVSHSFDCNLIIAQYFIPELLSWQTFDLFMSQVAAMIVSRELAVIGLKDEVVRSSCQTPPGSFLFRMRSCPELVRDDISVKTAERL